MNVLIGLLGVAIFAAAIYGIVKHQKSQSSGGGYTGGGAGNVGGGTFENRPGENPQNKDTQLER